LTGCRNGLILKAAQELESDLSRRDAPPIFKELAAVKESFCVRSRFVPSFETGFRFSIDPRQIDQLSPN
jgi:hypothetical protein